MFLLCFQHCGKRKSYHRSNSSEESPSHYKGKSVVRSKAVDDSRKLPSRAAGDKALAKTVSGISESDLKASARGATKTCLISQSNKQSGLSTQSGKQDNFPKPFPPGLAAKKSEVLVKVNRVITTGAKKSDYRANTERKLYKSKGATEHNKVGFVSMAFAPKS